VIAMPFRKGWTLIELLTVIAVIAVLAAILLPVFHQAREKARQATCISQLKQLASATLMYAQDHDEVLPCFWDYYDGEGKFGGWIFYSTFGQCLPGNFDPSKGSIYPYIRNAPIYTCPSDRCRQGNSYAYNGALSPNPVAKVGPGFHFGLPLAAIQEPANIILFTEEETGHGSTDDGHHLPEGNYPTTRHHGRSNFAFCDGHVKALLPDNVPSQSFRYWP
jgi:prepilin-type N-terminal cleavage/methylation domain-containing protein/prepilin-type processing-associated H-X9-DG protein